MAKTHRCQGTGCVCREARLKDDQEEKRPPETGLKRYELRLAPSIDKVWLEVEGRGVLFTEGTTGPVCAYVDLPAGRKARIVYHVESVHPNDGTALDLRVSEYGPKGAWWYDTARIHCGGGGDPCDRASAEQWIAEVHGLTRGLLDPCGSTKLEEPKWSSPEREVPHLPVVTTELLLHVYSFDAKFAPGTPGCTQKKDNL